MKYSSFYIGILLFIGIAVHSQNNQCNCPENLDKTISKTEENYAGFPTKVNSKTQSKYNVLVKTLRKKSSKTSKAKDCFYIIKDYIRFFEDKHFILSYNNDKDFDNEIINYNEDYFNKEKLEPIEGIWTNPDNTMKLAIRKTSKNIYKSIIIESKDSKFSKGFVYITLTVNGKQFIAKEYNSFLTTDIPAKQNGNLLQIWNHEMWGKIYPSKLNSNELEELNTWKDNNNGLVFKKLNIKTSYLKIPTFYNNDDKIQQLISKNDSEIRSTENLIIDLSGNGGGNTGWIHFLPYIITNPIVQKETYLRVTPDNVKSKLTDLEPFATNPIPDDYRKYFPEHILNAYKKAYSELPKTDAKFYPIPSVSFPVDQILSYPKKVAVVFDNFCGSSTEYFFDISKQSTKIKRYGTNTIGMMDYEGMSTPTPLPYDKFILTIPIVKSSWTDQNPIDKTGFQPEILLDHLPKNEWIPYIAKDLEK